MKEMGLEVIRIGEFAWSIFEPAEGRFDFSLFDSAMDLAAQHNLEVILGTPTATPPAWLTYRYPETLNASSAGIPYRHGQRRHYNYNSPIYRELSARIAGRMAQHYRGHPALIGWQIDNELNCELDVFYSEADHTAFRVWLREKYTTLDRLNDAWGTVFWSQTYTDWEQIRLTGPTPSGSPNPHQALDEKRFISDSAIAYARLQAEAIRSHDKTHFITTNGLFGHLDNHRMTGDLLDFFSYDSYPQFGKLWPDSGEDPLLDRKWSQNLSVTRDISPQFCVMEQQSGPGGWVNRLEQTTPKPGQLRLWTYQSVAHGADLVLYFRWRTALFGTEIYWHGINDYHNRPNRRCAEVAQVASELTRIGDEILGGRYVADVAILKDYDNEWDGELDSWHGPYERLSTGSWFKTLQHRHVPVDMVYLRSDTTAEQLAGYRVVIYPHPTILTQQTADLLKAYAGSGGTVILGCRTGYKDPNGHCNMLPFPGHAAELCGVTVEEFTRIGANDDEPELSWWAGASRHECLRTGPFNDVLHVESPDATVLATYGAGSGHYMDRPALVENPWGAGRALYYGGVFRPGVVHAIADYLGLNSPLEEILSLPRDVELAIREQDSGDRLAFLLNYSGTAQGIAVSCPLVDALTGTEVLGDLSIEPYGVLVLRL
jgi:beta-galactosidase